MEIYLSKMYRDRKIALHTGKCISILHYFFQYLQYLNILQSLVTLPSELSLLLGGLGHHRPLIQLLAFLLIMLRNLL